MRVDPTLKTGPDFHEMAAVRASPEYRELEAEIRQAAAVPVTSR